MAMPVKKKKVSVATRRRRSRRIRRRTRRRRSFFRSRRRWRRSRRIRGRTRRRRFSWRIFSEGRLRKAIKKFVATAINSIKLFSPLTKEYLTRFVDLYLSVRKRHWTVTRILKLIEDNYKGGQQKDDAGKHVDLVQCPRTKKNPKKSFVGCIPYIGPFITASVMVHFFRMRWLVFEQFQLFPPYEPVDALIQICTKASELAPVFVRDGEHEMKQVNEKTVVVLPTTEAPAPKKAIATNPPTPYDVCGSADPKCHEKFAYNGMVYNDLNGLNISFHQRQGKSSFQISTDGPKAVANGYPYPLFKSERVFGKYLYSAWLQRVEPIDTTENLVARAFDQCYDIYERTEHKEQFIHCLHVAQNMFFLERNIYPRTGEPSWATESSRESVRWVFKAGAAVDFHRPVEGVGERVTNFKWKICDDFSSITSHRRRCGGGKDDDTETACHRVRTAMERSTRLPRNQIKSNFTEDVMAVWKKWRPKQGSGGTVPSRRRGRSATSKMTSGPPQHPFPYPTMSDIDDNFILGKSPDVGIMYFTDSLIWGGDMMYGKNAKLPGRLVFYFIRAPENYILEEAYKPMGYRRGTRLLYYPWVECIHGLCHGAMRFNYMTHHPRKCQCEAGESGVVDPQDCSPEVLYQQYRSASERTRGIRWSGRQTVVTNVTVTSVQEAQMALTRASISKCSGNVEIPTDSPQRMLAENNRGSRMLAENNRESLEMNMRAPTCASKVEVDLSSCNTCCCKQGLAKTRIGHNLIQGDVRDCGTWFGFNDAMFRSFLTLFRSGWAVDKFGMKCFAKF